MWLAGRPKPQARARYSRAGGIYYPTGDVQWRRAAEKIFREAMAGAPPIQGPVQMNYTAIYTPPKGYTQAKAAAALAGELPYIKTPDLDNLLKMIQDAMNGIVFMDDKQICRIVTEKQYGVTDRTRVTVTPLPYLYQDQET